MTVTIDGTTGVTSPEVTLDNSSADGGQVVLKSSGYSNWNWDNYSGRLRAYYGSTEYFTVNASGNVGIGTSSPSFTGVSRRALTLNAPSGQLSILELGVNGTIGGYLYSNASQVTLTSSGATPITLETNGSERMRIDSGGNLLVGTTSSLARVTAYHPNSTIAVCESGVNTAVTQIAFRNPNGFVGSITTNGSTTAFNTSSDYRLKENIQPMTGALATVAQLNPVTYTWKADGSDGQGFIAHELQAVVPDCVTGEKDAVDEEGNPVYQGIDTSFLVATLTKAIQELSAKNDALEARLAALEAK